MKPFNWTQKPLQTLQDQTLKAPLRSIELPGAIVATGGEPHRLLGVFVSCLILEYLSSRGLAEFGWFICEFYGDSLCIHMSEGYVWAWGLEFLVCVC